MRVFLVCAIAGAFLLYGIALEAPFQLDDTSVLEIARTFRASATRPLGYFTFWLDHQFIPIFAPMLPWITPFYHRIVNVLIHAFAASALFWLTRELTGNAWVSAVAATLFLVHPVQTQAVTYVTQRFESQAVLFMLLSAGSYVRFRRTALKRWLAATLLWGSAAGFTKEVAVALPVWLLLIEMAFFSGWKLRNWILYWIPLGGIALALIFLAWPSLENAQRTLTWVPWHQYFLTQGAVVTKYLELIIWPRHQFLIYEFAVSEGVGFVLLVKWLLVFAVIGTGLYGLKRNPLAGFGILSFFILLSPVLVLPLPDLVNEHRVYGAFAGIAIAAAAVLHTLPPRYAFSIVAVVSLALGLRTVARNSEWNDPVAFWEMHRQAFPNDPSILARLGSLYYERGAVNRALDLFLEARKNESRHNAYYRQQGHVLTGINLATVYLAKNNPQQAKVEAERAVAADPDEPFAWRSLGYVQLQLGEYGPARSSFERMATLAPGIDAWYGLQEVAAREGDLAAVKEAEAKIKAEEERMAAVRSSGLQIPVQYRPYFIYGLTALLLAAIVAGFATIWTAVRQWRAGGREVA